MHPVALVGAGPGDPELLTVKARRLIEEADVVVYDKLVAPPILALIPPGKMRIFAGKIARRHFMPQGEINRLLVTLAQAGHRVVRLKGGDPFVFGRGGEEAEYLAHHGIPFEVVPGITSASACAAYAGIPLTHRGLSHGLRIVTGHTQDARGLDLNWSSLADPDTTLIVYMGRTNARPFSAKLIEHGLGPDTPAAAVINGTRPEQQSIIATLSTLADRLEAVDKAAPTLLIIGQVVSLAPLLDWYTPSPVTTDEDADTADDKMSSQAPSHGQP